MNYAQLKGTGVALVTPFNQQGEVDFDALQKLIEHVIAGGVNYLVALGTTGEPSTLNNKEKKLVFEFILETNNGRLPVVIGIGGNNTASLVSELEELSPLGFTAVLSASPYYNKPTQEGIFRHYKALAEASPLPILLYNVPGRTGSNVSAQTTLRLASEVKNVIGIKEASGNFEQFSTIMRNKPEDFLFISGDDAIALPLLSIGGDGLISVAANAVPSEISEMVKLALNDQFTEAGKYHHRLSELVSLLFEEGNPAGVKSALAALGIGSDFVRLPLAPVSNALSDKIALVMNGIKEFHYTHS